MKPLLVAIRRRRGAVLVLVALLLVLLVAIIAFAVDLGYIALVRTELQAVADAAALAGAGVMSQPSEVFPTAQRFANQHRAGGKTLDLVEPDVEIGLWDSSTRSFVGWPSGNAVRVKARRDETANGPASLFFARIFGKDTFQTHVSAVAMVSPRDIVFVVDLSGSMNDDTEPGWATSAIGSAFGPQGNAQLGDELAQKLYDDFGFGAFPGALQYLGEPAGVPADQWAYAELTKNDGPLTRSSIANAYRINRSDDEPVRKQKAYRWIIDYQVAAVMPNARPAANSGSSYAYWEKYLDYILIGVNTALEGSAPPPEPPATPVGLRRSESNLDRLAIWHGATSLWPQLMLALLDDDGPEDRGFLPPNQDSDRIGGFNNPNRDTFSTASGPSWCCNRIGYRTYVQFMLDHGRDLQPDGQSYVPLSVRSPECPYHQEQTAGGNFWFPPSEQPMHAARRALIAAIQVVKERNQSIPSVAQRDWVSIVSFDKVQAEAATLRQPLTADYDTAMQECTLLQAVGDKGASTTTEAGLDLAKRHLAPADEGGQGRPGANKVVILLTDGVPNAFISTPADIEDYMQRNSDPDFYQNGAYSYDASLMQTRKMRQRTWNAFPVGTGLGTDYDFMDRMARMGGTDSGGQSPRGSGNPAEYEQRLTDTFRRIINSPKVRLVQ